MAGWPYLVAGVLTILLGGAHGVIGERTFLRRVRASALPRYDQRTLRLVWHLFTVAMVVTGALLVAISTARVDVAAGRALAVILGAWGVFFAVYVAAIDPRLLVRVPQPLLLMGAALLAWFGGGP
ncbi:MAG TPA: hypothetical protein VGR85_10635 [Candidatus Limnocylindria bacterium]|nr:hypothetical protein [Candidatus Limnocylindria bacterium]